MKVFLESEKAGDESAFPCKRVNFIDFLFDCKEILFQGIDQRGFNLISEIEIEKCR